MKKVLLMTCTAVMLFAAGSVCAAERQAGVAQKAADNNKEVVSKVAQKSAGVNAVAVKKVETKAIAEADKEVEVKTVAQKAKKASCKVGSHESHAWIKARNKNCTNCGTQKDSQGKKVYYCYCDCAKAEKAQPDPKCPKGYSIAVDERTGKKSCDCVGYLLKDKTCAACPKNAVCNGKTVACAKGYDAGIEEKTGKTHCECGGYLLKNKTCAACPKNAVCNGNAVTCAKGYDTEIDVKTGKTHCECGGYLLKNKTCAACPKNAASCDGTEGPKGVKCKKGFGAMVESTTLKTTCVEDKDSERIRSNK